MYSSDIPNNWFFNASVAEKLNLAERLFHRYGTILLDNEDIRLELEYLKSRARQINDHMAAMDMGGMCISCAGENGGGCCSLFMAGETDTIQLLMNMLAGVPVSMVRDDNVECCFLGGQGCLFLLKPMFCLNYNCRKIHDVAHPGDMAELDRLTGSLLRRQYRMEQRLLQLLRQLPANGE